MFIESLEKGWGVYLSSDIDSSPFPFKKSITIELLQHVKRK